MAKSCKSKRRSMKRSMKKRSNRKCSRKMRKSPRKTRANPKHADNVCLGMKKDACSTNDACNWGKRSGCKRRPTTYKKKAITYAV
jgi:hypothetical protein